MGEWVHIAVSGMSPNFDSGFLRLKGKVLSSEHLMEADEGFFGESASKVLHISERKSSFGKFDQPAKHLGHRNCFSRTLGTSI